MTPKQLTISWDEDEVRTFAIYQMTHHLGPQHGVEWKVHVSRQFNLLNVHGNTVGECWGYAIRPTAQEAWDAALASMREMAAAKLASQNAREHPQSGDLAAGKSAEDMGL